MAVCPPMVTALDRACSLLPTRCGATRSGPPQECGITTSAGEKRLGVLSLASSPTRDMLKADLFGDIESRHGEQ